MSKGLTMTMIFLAESANYGESLGNVATLKKITRGKGEQYTYISRQAIRYNIVEQLDEPLASLSAEGSGTKQVIQFDQHATIDKYPEVDLFGYMKTAKGDNALTRSAKVRLSNAVSLETYKGDTDFLTNMGLAKRLRENGDEKAMNSIAQSEIHRSFYRYTVTVDLDEIGIDRNVDIELSNEEKSRRVQKLLDTIQYLYRDIRGRRENLQPLFVVGGVYERKIRYLKM
ncbi:type I-B CRISPR-associated protein Cas7/Cst2/DevR [Enterococcus avium]|uniref:type I-B CRISPR-associated protein Cas7/Cst2/DevR n=1 Tax=Enterococcus avium TaxID=33945 RepID=UPI00288FFED9|nr:type I-B CRISPR-associated protein Cas7/Cst2/DevR [Enterococcus avium]MDT2425716.1 type I-B CRISPR-associated protein Cas7/Cst2/DevR [Enterococcus avium]